MVISLCRGWWNLGKLKYYLGKLKYSSGILAKLNQISVAGHLYRDLNIINCAGL